MKSIEEDLGRVVLCGRKKFTSSGVTEGSEESATPLKVGFGRGEERVIDVSLVEIYRFKDGG